MSLGGVSVGVCIVVVVRVQSFLRFRKNAPGFNFPPPRGLNNREQPLIFRGHRTARARGKKD